MGSLLIDIGQCGNQIGLQLIDYFESTSHNYEDTYLKNSDQNTFHSIHIDTEPKIIKPLIENRKKYFNIDPKNVLFFQHGRGNNWSLGYMDEQKLQNKVKNVNKPLAFNKFTESQPYQLSQNTASLSNNSDLLQTGLKGNNQEIIPSQQMLKENTQILENLIDIMRKEIEKIDYCMGIHMISSLGGGTGSGLGSRLIEEFRDLFSDIQIINTVVFPHKSGETTLQHYNCALSLAHLQKYSDCIIYFQNDKVNSYLNLARSSSVEKAIDLTNINQYIASNLFNLLKLNDYSNFDRFYFDILLDAAPMDDYKFVEVFSTPYYFNKTLSTGPDCHWEKVIDSVLSQVNIEDNFITQNISTKESEVNEIENLLKGNKEQIRDVSLSVQTIFRSFDVNKSIKGNESALKSIDKKMHQTFNPVKWNPDCFNYEFIEYKLKDSCDNKMMLTVANRSTIANVIQNINETAYSKFKASAYLHSYYQYGMEKADFEEALLTLDNIYDNYSNLK
ncbi:hypothetical protein ABPG74_009601 [Tetrahymena malaccensis]